MKHRQTKSVWVVVEAQSGIPTLAEVYGDKIAARKRGAELRREMRQDYDEVGLFEARVRGLADKRGEAAVRCEQACFKTAAD